MYLEYSRINGGIGYVIGLWRCRRENKNELASGMSSLPPWKSSTSKSHQSSWGFSVLLNYRLYNDRLQIQQWVQRQHSTVHQLHQCFFFTVNQIRIGIITGDFVDQNISVPYPFCLECLYIVLELYRSDSESPWRAIWAQGSQLAEVEPRIWNRHA